jgi:hypothetical protein
VTAARSFPTREPMWRRALLNRDAEKLARTNRTTASLICLVNLLAEAKHPVSMITARTWTREEQGEAYLWARAVLLGREDVPAPECVAEGSR